jgi:hypothetical protein
MTPKYERAYRAATAADERYQRALEREHGGRAGDVRYIPARQSAAVRRLGAAKRKADERMRKALEEMRSKGNPKGEIVGFTLANRGRRKSAKKGNKAMAKTRRARRRNAGSGANTGV